MKKSTIILGRYVAFLGVFALFSIPLWGQSPGGVSTDLNLWVKANAGTSTTTDGATVNTWSNQVSGGTDLTQNLTNDSFPSYSSLSSDAHNFNPVIQFGEAGVSNGGRYAYDNTLNFSETTFFFVSKSVTDSDFRTLVRGGGNNQHGIMMDYNSSNLGSYDGDFNDSSLDHNVGEIAFFSVQYPNFFNDSNPTVFSKNGGVTANAISDGTLNGAGYNFIGNQEGAGEQPYGDVSEVIIYETNTLSATDIQKINSYLAVKYGVTLGNTTATVDYVSSTGTTVWTGNSTYQNGIFGIGVDSGSDLDQQISAPVEDKDIILSTDNDFTSTNGSHGVSLADNTYVILGHNGGDKGFSSINYSGTNIASANSISSRHWLVQETGTVGNVWVKSNDAGATYLIQSSDTTFDDSDTWTLLDGNQAVEVDLANGEYLTFAGFVTGPGGVGGDDFRVWLKSDEGVTESSGKVSALESQSAYSSTFVENITGDMPNLVANAINFNPSLEFLGSQDLACLGCSPGVVQNQNAPNGDELHIIYMALPSVVNGAHTIFEFEGTGSSADAPAFEIRTANVGVDVDDSNFQQSGYHSSFSASANTPIMVSTFWNNRDGSSTIGETQGRIVNTINGYDESVITAGDGTTNKIGNDIIFGAGDSDGNGDPFQGYLPEVIMYTKELSAIELQKVNTYLAVKYGLTLGNVTTTVDYLSSTDATVWTGNSTYQNGVFGIARDLGSALNQQISTPIEDKDIILSTDNDFTSTNGSHGVTLADNTYVILGHNGGDKGFSSINYSGTNIASTNSISSRHWLVQETGTVGNVWVKSNDAGATYLIQSSDTTFDDSDTWTLLDGNQAVEVDLSNGEYLTFAGFVTGPGGVGSDLNLWVKANAGTSTTTDGATVNTWVNQVSGGTDLVQNLTNNSFPSYSSLSSDVHNFNPVIQFGEAGVSNGGRYTYDNTLNISETTLFFVSKSLTNSGYRTLVKGSVGNHFPVLMGTNSVNLGSYDGNFDDSNLDHSIDEVALFSVQFPSSFNNSNPTVFNKNGDATGNAISSVAFASGDYDLIGNLSGGGGQPFGDVSEMIIYETNTLSATDIQKINSYLAVKYGITLGNTTTTVDYLSSTDVTVWTGDTTYQNDIVGIAKDGGSGLEQQISKSVNGTSILTLSTDSDFTSVSGNHTAIGTNNSYVVSGNDAGATATVASTSSNVPSVGMYPTRITRQWKVEVTGYDQAINMKFDGYDDTYAVLLDADGDFSSGGSVLGFLNASGELLGATLPVGTSYFTLVQPEDVGLDLTALDTAYVIDFDTTVAGINDGQIDGSGLSYDSGTTGRLNSRGVVVRGIDGVTTDFGADYTTGDFALGNSTGGAPAGGLYAFEVATGDHALGLSPDADDLSTGSVSIAFTNKTGSEVTELLVSYELYHYNNGSGTHEVVFGYGASVDNPEPVLKTVLESDAAALGSPVWERNYVTGKFTGLSVAAGESLVLTWSTTAGSDDIALDDISIVANPSTSSSSLSGEVYDVKVLDTDLDIDGATDLVDSMTIDGGAVTTNNNLVFKSSAGKSAVLNEILNGGTITGNVTVEQYYAAQRAYRFISSPVDMAGTVFDNWQQGGLNVGDSGYEAGVGTQVTGGTSGLGFDQSTSNNPSMFNFSNDASQSWSAAASTNGLTLSAGDASRLMIRGDRSIDLTVNATAGLETILNTEGSLKTGDVVKTYASDLSTGDYIHVGNPYQARLDIESVLNDVATQGVNTGFGYLWNPLVGTNGAYRLYNYSTDAVTPADAAVDGVLQPSQSMFLQVDSSSPSLTFRESAKVEGSTMLSTFSSTPHSTLRLDVYRDVTDPALDGILVLFSANGNDGIDTSDAPKLVNPNENIALLNGVDYFIMENRGMPQNGTVLPLYNWGFGDGDYIFNLNVGNLNTNLNVYLHDIFTGEYTDINTGSLLSKTISFDTTNSASMDPLRFSIVFSSTTLSVLDELATSSISVYPNPVVSDDLIVNGLVTGKTSVALYTLSGQVIFNREYDVTTRELTVEGVKGLSNGIYLLQVTQGEHSNTVKVVVNK